MRPAMGSGLFFGCEQLWRHCLATDLPEEKGVFERNIKRMLSFYQEYSADSAKVPQAVAQLEITDLKQTPRSHKKMKYFLVSTAEKSWPN